LFEAECVLDGRQGVQVYNAIDALVVILQGDVVLERAQVVAQMGAPSGADARKDAAFFSHNFLATVFVIATLVIP
jgi:hypothetical protein